MKTNHLKLLGLAVGAILAMGSTAGFSAEEPVGDAAPLTLARKEAGQSYTAAQTTFTSTSADNLGGDANISYSTAKGGSTTVPAIYDGQIRLYQNSSGGDGGSITVTAKTGYKITSVEIGSGMSTTVRYYLNGVSSSGESGISIAKDNTYTASGLNNESVTFVCNGTSTKTRLYVNHLSVTYIEDSSIPDDTKVTQVKLSQGSGATTIYQGGTIDPTGFEVSLVYGSDTDPSYSAEEAIEPDDSRLTWNIDTAEIGEKDLTVTFVDGDVSLVSNALIIEVLEDPLGDTIIDVLTSDSFPVKQESSYEDCSYTSPNGIAYKSNNAGSYDSIQIRVPTKDTQAPSGIVSTTTIGTVKIVEIAFSTNNTREDRVVDIYGSHEAYTAPSDLYGVAEPIGSIAVAGGKVGVLDISALPGAPYEYIGIRSQSGAIYIDQIRIGYEKVEAPTDAEVVAKFVEDYMHMDDYDSSLSGVGTNACLGADGYYVKARTALLSLTAEQIELFRTDEQFASAKARYEAWAKINGDASPYEGTFTASAAARINNDDHAEYWIVAGISVAAIAGAAAMFFLRKKKEA